ncbi:hypothetical protein DCAR_0207523 [Daucus carota subsp. sativus]|uniref:AB hydrolase-1 domain-containing protein n=2 Tax=Daucus carota subsp. sativus TaxID=79200 RepID=A0AAF1AML3_DAUCS|nr:hypothetical protein DCAR_0207523 [Daucus carota subsp. sativus]
MDFGFDIENSSSPYIQLLKVATLIPISHYLLGFSLIFLTFLYNFLEFHFFQDFFSGFQGQPVLLTFDSCSQLYKEVASKCQILHGRYLATPWLSSPHFQTVFLSFYGRAPSLRYKRELFITPDGGTIALDWAMNQDGMQVNGEIHTDDTEPVVVMVPGLTSDSDAAYVKHFAFKIVKRRWKVVVSNHRGLGGISITSDCFYNGGWTEDIRTVVKHIHQRYPEAPLFVVGTSLGANIVVKYLGEEGANIPISGAAAVCSPYDLLISDRFLNRGVVQKFYDKVLTLGLKDFAQLHQPVLSRLADWDSIMKSRTVRDFDNYATRIVGKFETVDTFYRRCSSSSYVCNVMVPLLCINSVDDPVCTKESIPWDECRTNKNIILSTTEHGGHLAYFEGMDATNLWWVRAVDEFLGILQSSKLMHKPKEVEMSPQISPLKSSIDQSPFLNVVEHGLITAVASEPTDAEVVQNEHAVSNNQVEACAISSSGNEPTTIAEVVHNEYGISSNQDEYTSPDIEMDVHMTDKPNSPDSIVEPLKSDTSSHASVPVMKYLYQLSRHTRKSFWLLAYIALVTSLPFVGSALQYLSRKKLKSVQKR